MENGIEVLATNNIYTYARWCSIGFGISLAIMISLFILVVIRKGDVPSIIPITWYISIVCIFIFAFCMEFNNSRLDHVEYQVTISDNVPMTEFNSKYEIVNQNGKIYTIKKKGD